MKDKVVKNIRKALPSTAVQRLEEGYRKGRINMLQARFGFPARGMKVIAVTGTNGKTTTCAFINAMLKDAGYTTAMLTTATVEMAGKVTPNRIHRTVPLTADLLQFLREAKAKKVDFVLMEGTSQALDQHKLVGIPIEVAVMTNLTQDHLDYHKTMERYAAAKARLFNDYMKPRKVVLNADDEWFDYYKKESVGEVLTYGKTADVQVKINDLTPAGTEIVVTHQGETVTGHLQLVGEFNVQNASAAIATGLQLGLSLEQSVHGVAALEAVAGRMEAINEGQDFGVIVDYAHAPDAIKNVLKTLQQLTKGRVIIVFGSAGERDALKRPLMGEIAVEHADLIFLTDDEPYSDDPATIRADIMKGIKKAKGEHKTTEIGDRLEAIKAAFKEAKKGDVVLLAGLGHQDYRGMKDGNMPWDEREIARKLLK